MMDHPPPLSPPRLLPFAHLSMMTMKIVRCHFRRSTTKLLLFLILLLIVAFFFSHFIFIKNSTLKTSPKKSGDNNNGQLLLFGTAMFPRGGDRMEFDQPWALADGGEIYASVEDLMARWPRAKFITSDFGYSPGLGNLMFQFAALLAMAHREGAFLVLPAGCMLRRAFPLDAQIVRLVRDEQLSKFISEKSNDAPHQMGRRVVEFKDCCKFDAAQFGRPIFTAGGGRVAIVNGYFQSFRYFHPEFAPLVRANFKFLPGIEQRAKRAMEGIRQKIGSVKGGDQPIWVGVHVRHGMDLTMHGRNQRYGHVAAPKEYFRRAMERIRKGTAAGAVVVFLVAADNLAWAKKNIVIGMEDGEKASKMAAAVVHFLDSRYREVDMATLALCNNTILSTGTFGWWIGYMTTTMGEEEKGEVAYFGGWPRAGTPLDGMVKRSDYFPPEWIPIE